MELDELEREEIARLIVEGYTSGRLDDGNGNHVSWNISIEKWNDNDISIEKRNDNDNT